MHAKNNGLTMQKKKRQLYELFIFLISNLPSLVGKEKKKKTRDNTTANLIYAMLKVIVHDHY